MNTLLLESIHRLKEFSAITNKPGQIILRILAAVFGGYALTNSMLAALALLPPWQKVDALFFSSLFPALSYPAAVLWAFAASTAQRAWRDLSAITLIFILLSLASAWLR